MALSDTEKAQLAEIVKIPHPDLVAAELALILGTSQETILKADLARFQVIRPNYGRLNGKHDDTEFDPEEERSAIRRRIITMLDIGQLVLAYAGNSAGQMMILRA